ncbi:uncharacterized protein LOC127102055 [Lathyrus oleraceus]|uniref:uncharacterized protein LOC127102055 n=1 Tax=Pisum sativum TaxID=3888 RepID=UPI0021CE4874|nr:uncharacterized protein LOC127102055 [Pisum sativum]
MKRKREPFEKKKKKKKKKKSLKLGESLATQKHPVPLSYSAPSKSPISEAPIIYGSRQIASSVPLPLLTLSTSVTTSSTSPSTQTTAPRAKSKSKQQTSLLPSTSEPTPFRPIFYEPNASEPQTSDPITSSLSLPKFNLHTTSIPISEAIMFNEPISPPISSNPSSPLSMT